MRIVYGTDFTESARRAGTVAAMLATRFEDDTTGTILMMANHRMERLGRGAGYLREIRRGWIPLTRTSLAAC